MSFKFEELSTSNYPHAADIPFGNQTLSVTYRDLPDDWLDRILPAIQEEAEALGFPARVWAFTVIKGELPTGMALRELEDATEALDQEGRERRDALARKTHGALCATVLGWWDADKPISADNCALLPDSLRRTILLLAQSATLSPEKKTTSFAARPSSPR